MPVMPRGMNFQYCQMRVAFIPLVMSVPIVAPLIFIIYSEKAFEGLHFTLDKVACLESLWSSFFAAVPLLITSSGEVFQSWARLLKTENVEMEFGYMRQNIGARLLPSLIILLPNIILRFVSLTGSSLLRVGLVQLIMISDVIGDVAITSDKNLRNKKYWLCIFNSLNGLQFILGNRCAMQYATSIFNPFMTGAIVCSSLLGIFILWRLCCFFRESHKEKRVQALFYYILHIVLISVSLSSTFCISLGTTFLLNRIYLLSWILVAISCYTNRTLRDAIVVVSTAAAMNYKFIRFLSHELRSHLSHMTIGLDLMLNVAPVDSAGGEDHRANILEMKDSLGSTVQILNDVVMYGELLRTSGGKSVPLPIEVESLVRRVVTYVLPQVGIECTHNFINRILL